MRSSRATGSVRSGSSEISGGSAGGYTTLAALTFRDFFQGSLRWNRPPQKSGTGSLASSPALPRGFFVGVCSHPMVAVRRSTGGPVPRKDEPIATTSSKGRPVTDTVSPLSSPSQSTPITEHGPGQSLCPIREAWTILPQASGVAMGAVLDSAGGVSSTR
jgi:hypothetical protein